MTQQYIGQVTKTSTIKKWLVAPTGTFKNPDPSVGDPSIIFQLAVRQQIDGEKPIDKSLGKQLVLTVSTPPQVIPHINPETFTQIQYLDADGNLIPGTYFTGDQAKFMLECLFVAAVSVDIQAGTIMQGVNPAAMPDFLEVLQAMGVQP